MLRVMLCQGCEKWEVADNIRHGASVLSLGDVQGEQSYDLSNSEVLLKRKVVFPPW